jgi:MFS family permease
MGGAFGYRVPPSHWQPEGWAPPPPDTKSMITHGQVRRWVAVGTPQFWLIWAVLFLNVSAGIGVIGMASPMLQEIFGGALIGHPDIGFTALDDSQKKAIAAIAAGFAGLISLFNIAGRFFWASMSDRIGRKNTYFTFFLLGIACYALSPWAAHAGSKVLFVAFVCIILSMYGGGFATVPAYLADMFGTLYVGAIHGVLLTAWSAAGILGPVIVNYVREFEIAAGAPRDLVYDRIFYALACLLVLGFIANLLIRPVNRKRFMSVEEVVAVTGARAAEHAHDASMGIGRGGLTPAAVPAWLVVGIPIAWGVWVTVQTAMKLFG